MLVHFDKRHKRRIEIEKSRHVPWGAIKTARYALGSLIGIAKSRFEQAPKEEQDRRLDICNTCEHWKPQLYLGAGGCDVCKCSKWKLSFAASACPRGKWSAYCNTRTQAPEDTILEYYRGITPKRCSRCPGLNGDGLTNAQKGLGDTIIMSDVAFRSVEIGKPVRVFTSSPHQPALQRFNPYIGHEVPQKWREVWNLYSKHDLGNGHLIQRLARAFNLPVEVKPQGKLIARVPKVRNRVILHFEPGRHVLSQRACIHPRARMLYPDNRAVIERFVAAHPQYQFIQIGGSQSQRIGGADCRLNLPLDQSLDLIASAEWFLGIISGPMHAATAFGCRCVVVVNFPSARNIVLPTLKVTGQVEEEWFYPQNTHLHQDEGGPLVPQFTFDTLQAAFDGNVYPFWSDKYLGLINEKP